MRQALFSDKSFSLLKAENKVIRLFTLADSVSVFWRNNLHRQAEPSAVGNKSSVQVRHTPALVHSSQSGISQAKIKFKLFICYCIIISLQHREVGFHMTIDQGLNHPLCSVSPEAN